MAEIFKISNGKYECEKSMFNVVFSIYIIAKANCKEEKYAMKITKSEVEHALLQKDFGENVIKMLDSYKHNENYYLIFPLYPINLESYLKQKNPDSNVDGISFTIPNLSLNMCQNLIKQIANGIGHIHDHGIIHRDIKARNILLTSDQKNGIPVITDFDASIEAQASSEIIGSQKYMAPEISNGNEYNNKVDVYSFGVLVYYMIFYPKIPSWNGLELKFPDLGDMEEKYDSVKDFLNKVLDKNPNHRPLIKEVLQHEFISKSKIIKNYKIWRIINEGYQGIVYETVNSLGEKYALKKMKLDKYSDREWRNLINISLEFCVKLIDSFIYKNMY